MHSVVEEEVHSGGFSGELKFKSCVPSQSLTNWLLFPSPFVEWTCEMVVVEYSTENM